MVQKLKDRWFLILLVSVLALGISFPTPLAPLADAVPQDFIIAAVLLAMALPLAIDALWTTLKNPGVALLGIAVNFVFVPLVAFIASRLLVDDLAFGMIIAAAVPSTLASASVWTRMAGGNDAVSLLITVATNLACFLVTPAWIHVLAGDSGIAVPFAPLVWKLLWIVVLPILAAQTLRLFRPVAYWSAANVKSLGIFAQFGILAIVFVGAVRCGTEINRLDERMAELAGQVALMLALVAAVHLVAWWFGFAAARKLGMSRADGLAVAFSGSQKTLMVGLAIAIQFGGLAVLPMVAYHVEQLLLGTLIAERCREAQASTAS